MTNSSVREATSWHKLGNTLPPLDYWTDLFTKEKDEIMYIVILTSSLNTQSSCESSILLCLVCRDSLIVYTQVFDIAYGKESHLQV